MSAMFTISRMRVGSIAMPDFAHDGANNTAHDNEKTDM